MSCPLRFLPARPSVDEGSAQTEGSRLQERRRPEQRVIVTLSAKSRNMLKYVRASVSCGGGYGPPLSLVPASAIHRCFLMHWCFLVRLCLMLHECLMSQRFSRRSRLSMA